MMGGKAVTNLISVQKTYLLYVTADGVLTCDNVINVPLACPVKRKIKLDDQEYYHLPVVEIITNVQNLKLEVVTNEGVTIEPFTTKNLSPLANIYSEPRFYLYLPRGTTAIKNVFAKADSGDLTYKLEFGVMPPPYTYDFTYLSVLTTVSEYHAGLIKKLTGRVDALEHRQIYVNRVGISDSPDFFVLPGSGDRTNVLGWEFTFSNAGKKLTLAYQNTTALNVIFNDIDITEYSLLALAYNSVSSVCNLYGITSATNGAITTQRLLASGFGQIIGVSQPLHLFIDNVEQNALEIGTGFEVFI